MALTESTAAFNAFEKQLKTLCLKEFPCGIGTWRETLKPTAKSKIKRKTGTPPQPIIDKVNSRFNVTLKDYGVQYEKTETLEEAVTDKFSPWNLDYSWSDEAKDLREIAVRSPWLIDERFVLNHFRTLRMIDKGVTEIDENLLKFSNLEELTLTANLLSQVNSKNLPRTLKVLELCANQISDLFSLCMKPPKLQHLGLGYNHLTYIDEYLTGDYWSELLSLDLSNNNLSDLLEIVRKLSTLPRLRNLVLQGNPLSLIPGYRGYVVDSLKKLFILDDIRISADEKHHFKGLAKRKEFILDEAKIIFEVKYIKNIPMPEELKNPEEQPEFPIIERKYYVQFMFLEDTSSKAEVFQITHDDIAKSSTPAGSGVKTDDMNGSGVPEIRTDDGKELEKNVNFADPEIQPVVNTANPPVLQQIVDLIPEVTVTGPGSAQGDSDARSVAESMRSQNIQASDADKSKLPLAPIKTEYGQWAEEIELNWSKMLVRDDLPRLRDFLKQGMEFSVIEEKILAFPAEESAPSPTGSHDKSGKDKSGKEKDKGKEKKDEKAKEKPKDAGKDKKKKKGEPDVEMNYLPPEYTTLASFVIPLEEFLEGEFEFENVYMHGDVDSGTKSPTSSAASDKKDKKDKKKEDGKKKDAKEKDKEGRKSPKGKDDKKDKGKAPAKGDKPPEDDEECGPPPPMEVSVVVRLHHWKTAQDGIRDEEERLKAAAIAAKEAAEEQEQS